MSKEITISQLEKAHFKVLKHSKYGKEWELIEKCLTLNDSFKKNTDEYIVALKICLISVTNSTNISRYKKKICLNDLTHIILSIKDFDKRLSDGDESLVEEISKKTKKKHINLFSFATKYCCYHDIFVYHNDRYSIYDSVIRENLQRFDNNAKPYKIKELIDKSDYKGFNKIIKEILDKNNIKEDITYRRRMFDHFVWSKYKDESKKTKKNKLPKKSKHPRFEKTIFLSNLTNKKYYFKTKGRNKLGVYYYDTDEEVPNWDKPYKKKQILRQACIDHGIQIPDKINLYRLADLLQKKLHG